MRVDAGEDPLPLQRIDARVTLMESRTQPRHAISSSSCRQGRVHVIGQPGTESELRLKDQCFGINFR